jgi:hypothetical protein
MAAHELADLPEEGTPEQYDVQQIVDLLKGRKGSPITIVATDHDTVLFGISDTGVLVSPDGVLPAEERFIWPGFILYYDGLAADDALAHYTILGTDRFILSAGADGEIGTTGGTATHTHTHSHTGAPHVHPGPSHIHGAGTIQVVVIHDHPEEDVNVAANEFDVGVVEGTDRTVSSENHFHLYNVNSISVTSEATGQTGSTAASGTANTGAASFSGPTGNNSDVATDYRPPWVKYYAIRRDS